MRAWSEKRKCTEVVRHEQNSTEKNDFSEGYHLHKVLKKKRLPIVSVSLMASLFPNYQLAPLKPT